MVADVTGQRVIRLPGALQLSAALGASQWRGRRTIADATTALTDVRATARLT